MVNIFILFDIFAYNLHIINKLINYQIAENYTVLRACTECWKSISELNGFLKGTNSEFNANELRLLFICETRNALELEGQSIAPIRLFEAYASENKLNEPLAALILELTQKANNHLIYNANTLNLNFVFFQKSVKNYQSLSNLQKELNDYLTRTLHPNPLVFLCILIGFVWCKKKEINNRIFLINTLLNQWMNANNLLQLPLLPLSKHLKNEFKALDELVIESFETSALENWMIYFLTLISNSATDRLQQLSKLIQLKRTTFEIIDKYTQYPLPAKELTELLFEKPFLKASHIIQKLECHRQTASTYFLHLEKLGIVVEKISGREKLYLHKKLVDILITD